jgi:pimeloyl-ACP methyl ester carboxylesterase
VVVGGIASRTADGASYEAFRVPELLGYPADRTYVFSYRGVDGPHLHEPYERADTYASLEDSAGRLTTLMLRIAKDHPGVGVDLIAHSQGGIVARTYLQRAARAWQAGLPSIEHLVTFATPHHGTDAAVVGDRLRRSSYIGAGITKGAGWLFPIPDPDAPALSDLTVDSTLIEDLARSDVLYGTQVLSMGTRNDLVVPGHRALYHRGRTAIVDGDSWVRSHSTILTAPGALALAHNFLRDGERACGEGVPSKGLSERAIEFVLRWAPTALGMAARPMTGGFIPGR